jgi:hypothetical protein
MQRQQGHEIVRMKVSDSMTETDSSSPAPQQFTFTLEVAPDDLSDADPALVDSVGRDTANTLRSDGYVLRPIYTGQRGGFLVDVITTLTPIATEAWANKDIILADTSALVTILSAAIPLARYVRKAYEKRVGKDIAQQKPIKITLDIDGTPIPIEVPDIESAEGIMKLAQRIQTSHSDVATKVISQTQIKVRGSVPKSLSRKRR